MKKYNNTLEPFAVGYLEAEQEDVGYRIASGFLRRAQLMPISIRANQMFAGWCDENENCGVSFRYGSGIGVNADKLRSEAEQYPEFAEELTDILEKTQEIRTVRLVHDKMTEKEWNIVRSLTGWGGGSQNWAGGHSNPGYDILLDNGTDGLRRKIAHYRTVNEGKDVFYDGLLLALDAVDVIADRYRILAAESAEKSADDRDRARLMRIAESLTHVPKNPPRDFFDACQMFWLVFCTDGIDSPGRFDQFMLPYWQKSEDTDRLTCLRALWQLFKDVRAWNLCISGSDAAGNDETNEISYAILDLVREFACDAPNVTMRVHKGTPEALWQKAAAAIATGCGMPAIYNDECVCPALEALGIPAEDAHDYCMNGCNQIDIFGKSHMGLEDGEVCLAKCLELTLNRGYDPMTGLMAGTDTGDPLQFDTYEKLYAAYCRQVEYVADSVMEMASRSQQIVSHACPNPHRSNLILGCIERGLDMKNRGPLYAGAQILAEGLADTVDSLAAVRYFVYDTHTFSMADMLDALKNNFEGRDNMYRDLRGFDKFGNDCAYVDAIYKDVTDHFYGYLLTKHPFRGGQFGGGCSTFSRAARYGGAIGALPNGKKKGENLLSDSIGAVPGCDTNGPTALIHSVLYADQTLAKSGNVMQMKFSKNMLSSPEGRNAFIALAKTYFAGGGQQLSINAVSREELLDAKIHPENHGNLIVRVGGYSDYFTALSEGLQDNIIARTELEL